MNRPRPAPYRPAGSDGVRHDVVERGLVVVAVAGLVVVAWIWVTGQLAALVASGRWAPMAVGDVPLVARRLPERFGDLRSAWPGPVRRLLPGDAPLLVVAAAVAVAFGAVAWSAYRLWVTHLRPLQDPPGWSRSRAARVPPTRPRPRSVRTRPLGPRGRRGWGAGRPVGARWATRRDIKAVTRRSPEAGRLVIGQFGRHLLSTEARHSVLVFGPTQSGKTTGLAIPAILEWTGPVLATSVKGDLVASTIGWRRSVGECWVFDPTASSGEDAAGWSPLAEAGDWRGAQRVAGWMVETTPARSGLNEGAFWFAAAAKQLGPLLLAARCGGLGMAEVVAWTNGGEWDHPARLLEAAGQREALSALLACEARDERIRSSVGTTLETVLAPFEDPLVVASTSGGDIDPQVFLAGANTLYLCGPSFEQGRLQGLFASLVSAVVAAAVTRSAGQGGPLDPPLLLVLDEVANIAPIRDLDALASTGAGLGIQLMTVCQDLAQLTARYGAERSATIANNHRAKVMLSGVADLATLDLVSGLAGEAAVREETMTSDLRDGRQTRTSSVAFRRLAPADELRRIPPGEGVVIYGHLPATRIRLRPWFQDRRLRRRVAQIGLSETSASQCSPAEQARRSK